MYFNLNEEIIDGHLVTAETKKLWAVEMDLAKKLLEVCRKHNLKIFAEAGTLLGAVRHKGFIPWDDDMDFAMMRDDYNKLVEIGPEEFEYPYFFQSIYTDNTWGGLIKIRNSETAMIDSTYSEWKERNSGIFIDVFVMDAIPEDEKAFRKEYQFVREKRRLLTRKGVYKVDFKSVRAVLRSLFIMQYFIIHPYFKIQEKIKDLLSSFKISEHKYCTLIDFYSSSGIDIDKVNRRESAWYNETIELPFGNIKLPAPKEYHKVLSSLYGDYMIPVKGGQLHSIIAIDSERSYKEVITKLKKKIWNRNKSYI